MKKVTIIFKTGINITINCMDYTFNNNTNNHELIISSDEVESIKEVQEKNDITGVLLD